MRHLVLARCALASLCLCLAGPAQAQDDYWENAGEIEVADGPRNTVTVDPLPLAMTGTLNVEYERVLSDYVTFYGAPSLNFGSWGLQVSGFGESDVSYFSAALTTGVRWFPLGEAPEGLFLAPQASLGYVSAGVDGEAETSAVGWGLGGLVGYTFLIGDVIDISLGLGAAYVDLDATVATDSGEGQVGSSGVLPIGRLAVGVAF